MKQPFRFFRGEFTGGFYLKNLLVCPNYAVQDVLDELVYQTLFQWKLPGEVTADEMPVREEDVFNIGKIAGVFQPRLAEVSPLGSVFFTQSYVVNGQQRSERGLMDMDTEAHRFVRTEADEYPDDIVNEATNRLRIALVPHGTKPAGYIPYGSDIYDEDGNILWENIVSEPPDDGTPYTPFYGEKFLIHQEFFNQEIPLPPDIFKTLIECCQRVRYNGPTIKSLLETTELLCTGCVYDVEIIPQDRYNLLHYRINNDPSVSDVIGRITAWLMFCAQKFKLFFPVLQE
jgi:hypothetical protein